MLSGSVLVLSLLVFQLGAFGADFTGRSSVAHVPPSAGALEPLSDIQTAKSLYLRGVALQEDSGADKDDHTAADLYRQAAELGYAPAAYNLGILYEEGRGVAQDCSTAAQWYRTAAELGDSEAQNNLGRLYALGRGVPADPQQAAQWYSKAAEQENAVGQNNLANCYREGRGVAKDLVKALELYQCAAMNGYAVAQNNLALMYANGAGTERDYSLATAWLGLAAEELPASKALLEQIQRKMSVEEVTKVKRIRNELLERIAEKRKSGGREETGRR